MATDFESLVPQGVADEVIAGAELESAAMRLRNLTRMPSGVESVPVVSVEPDVEWVDPRYGGRKPMKIEWTAARLEAEELAATLAIPRVWLDDTGFDVWQNVRERLTSAIAKRIDETLIFGAPAPVPSSFPTGGVVAVAGAKVSAPRSARSTARSERPRT
jgi:HK97 family phage major capsid protein